MKRVFFCMGMWACAGGTKDAVEGDCTALTSGTWTGDGAAMGMAMGVTLTFDEASCSFTLSDWTMAMDTPTGGTVVGDEVTLGGSPYWESCTGTATAPNAVSGVCNDDGADFSLTGE